MNLQLRGTLKGRDYTHGSQEERYYNEGREEACRQESRKGSRQGSREEACKSTGQEGREEARCRQEERPGLQGRHQLEEVGSAQHGLAVH